MLVGVYEYEIATMVRFNKIEVTDLKLFKRGRGANSLLYPTIVKTDAISGCTIDH